MKDLKDNQMWLVSRDLWVRGAVTQFLEDQIAGLKDAQGEPLPDHAKQFFLDVLFLRVKPPIKKTRKYLISEQAIKLAFDQRLVMLQIDRDVNPDRASTEETPKDAAIAEVAEQYGISDSLVSEIVYPRRARNKK